MQENRMYGEMLKVARAWLEGRQPEDIARKANVAFDGANFRLESLGTAIVVSYPQYAITPELTPWHQLLILHYLHLADGMALTGQKITFAGQKDGMVRGGGFDRKAEQALSRMSCDALKARCAALGGRVIKSNADYSAQLPFLPMYPVFLNYWQADEDFPASGRLLLDSSGSHYLTIEDSVVAGELILELLTEE